MLKRAANDAMGRNRQHARSHCGPSAKESPIILNTKLLTDNYRPHLLEMPALLLWNTSSKLSKLLLRGDVMAQDIKENFPLVTGEDKQIAGSYVRIYEEFDAVIDFVQNTRTSYGTSFSLTVRNNYHEKYSGTAMRTQAKFTNNVNRINRHLVNGARSRQSSVRSFAFELLQFPEHGTQLFMKPFTVCLRARRFNNVLESVFTSAMKFYSGTSTYTLTSHGVNGDMVPVTSTRIFLRPRSALPGNKIPDLDGYNFACVDGCNVEVTIAV